ncbi:DoxX family protein [Actinomadura decatromicini]|uniref:DoxX family protein n=1 Tax=Actinomadura decatromicini TaxID=2604572 RepID=A0A5D3FDV2_9ACTN|nr:DoxX family protein [Actinomadura decatromicini]TYK46299.1 DoxX family protein [Actinomadura decatromicini]
MRTRPLYDVVAALARVGVGIIFMAHGWQKIEAGITATGRSFDSLGVPLPTAAAIYSAFVEVLGGAALIAGLGLPITGVLLFMDMAGAFLFVHAENGVFLVDGGKIEDGYELVLALGLASLLFAAGGGGRLTVDRWIVARRLHNPDTEEEEEDDAASFVDSLRGTETPPAEQPPKKRRRATKTQPEPAETPDDSDNSEEDVMVAGARKAARKQRTPGVTEEL